MSGTGTWDAGTTGRGTRGAGRGDSKTLGLGDVGPTGLADVITEQTTPDFFAEFVKYNFRCFRERYYMLESLSAD